MATYVKFNQYVEDLNHGVHDFSNAALVLYFCNASNPPDVTNTVVGDLTTVSKSNLVAGSDELVINSEGQVGGLYSVDVEDKTLEADGGDFGPFRYVVMANDAAGSDAPLICHWDLGTNVTVLDGQQLILNMDNVNGVFRLS